MYLAKIGTKIKGYVTAGEAWTNRDFQVRFYRNLTPCEFKKRLDSGEILKYFAISVYLKGEPANEDIDAYIKAFAEKSRRYFEEFKHNRTLPNLCKCFSVSEISGVLDEAGVPLDDTSHALCLLDNLGIVVSLRYPDEYAEFPDFHEIAQKSVDINKRMETFGKRNDSISQKWKPIKISDLEGHAKTDAAYETMLGREYYIICAYRGISGQLEIADEYDNFMFLSTVLQIERDDNFFIQLRRPGNRI